MASSALHELKTRGEEKQHWMFCDIYLAKLPLPQGKVSILTCGEEMSFDNSANSSLYGETRLCNYSHWQPHGALRFDFLHSSWEHGFTSDVLLLALLP